MSKNLIIVESPAKANTLKKYLGKSYDVIATVGHIKNLPKSRLSVDIENGFEPNFELIKGKEKILSSIKKASKSAGEVYIATDPDREGEAIADHIAKEIDSGSNIHRVTFNEITKKAVLKALENPGKINTSLVEAQLARRVLDRLVGYKISPILWDKLRRGLSAGRVQSAALAILVKREKEIRNFKIIKYFVIESNLYKKDPKECFKVKLAKIDKKPVTTNLQDETEANSILEEIKHNEILIDKIERKERLRNPSPPFITSTFQQEAFRRFGFAAKASMAIAQKLYEGVEIGEKGITGLISYMRTDSFRISDDAIESARLYIKNNYDKAYLPSSAKYYSKKKSAQDAHEAIRPTDINITPYDLKGYLAPRELKIYDMIWRRFLSSQLASAVFDATSINIKSGKAGRLLMKATGSIMKFDGFLAAYKDIQNDETEDNGDSLGNDSRLPDDLKEKDPLKIKDIDKIKKETQPPSRYSEGSLIKAMDESGIGRPSTYASILSVIVERKYVENKEKKLIPTELGETVTELLDSSFNDIVDEEFTSKMESLLDDIENPKSGEDSKYKRVEVLRSFHDNLIKNCNTAKKEMKNFKAMSEETDIECDKCSNKMVIKFGRFGKFLACSNYPECKNTMPFKQENLADDPDNSNRKKEDIPTEFSCPTCGKPMVIKDGRFGQFTACSDYPTCKTVKNKGTGVSCPLDNCEGELIEKKTRRGKVFYSCSRYPECNYALWNQPVAKSCPECESKILEKKVLKSGSIISCPNKECNYKEKVE